MTVRKLIEKLQDCEGYSIILENQTNEEEFEEIRGKELIPIVDHKRLVVRLCLTNVLGTPAKKRKKR